MARLQEIGKKMARKKSLGYTRVSRLHGILSARKMQEAEKLTLDSIPRKGAKNAEKTRDFDASRD